MDQRIPVTLITGFLGAGKTTFLNQLIDTHKDTKFAIIENEFGEIGIDSELVLGLDEGIYELSNGCLCCTLNNELSDTLIQLIESQQKFDHLIIETTGIAEPDSIGAVFVSDPNIQSLFKLNATVCIVDAMHVEDLLDKQEELLAQITFADALIISKGDAVPTNQFEQVKLLLKKLNPLATIDQSKHGKTTINILDLKAYEGTKTQFQIAALPQQPVSIFKPKHAQNLVTISFNFPEAMDILKFRHWINVLLMMQNKGLYRIKGILYFEDEDRKIILQSVQKTFVFQRGDNWAKDETPSNKIVFIGKGLRREIFEKHLRSCLASSN